MVSSTNRVWSGIIKCTVIILFFSCRATKEIRRETNIYRRADKVIELTSANNLKYQTVSIKADVTLNYGKKKSAFKAHIRMKKDSVLWSSMSLLGIAGAKSLITRDSVRFINYRDKKYVHEDYGRIEELLKTDLLSLSNLQGLLLGDWIDLAEFDRYRLKVDSGSYLLTTLSERRIDKDWLDKKLEKFDRKIEKQEQRDAGKANEKVERKQEKKPEKYEGIAMEVNIDPVDLRVTRVRLIDYYFEGELEAIYSDFKDVDGNMIPHGVLINIQARNKINISMEYNKILVNDEFSTPYSVPEKYERVRL